MDDFIKELNNEIDRRIAIIESEDYERIPSIKPQNCILPVVLCALSAAILIIYYTYL